jgi:hypothetical protein
MAVGEAISPRTRIGNTHPDVPEMVPVSILSDWVDVCTAPETADNSGSTVVAPLGLTREELKRLYNRGRGTTLQIRLKYDDGISAVTSPVVQPFGFDGNDAPMRLRDAEGEHELELTIDLTNDVQDGTYGYTEPVEVDMDACASVLVAVKTAFNATGTKNNSTIQARLK